MTNHHAYELGRRYLKKKDKLSKPDPQGVIGSRSSCGKKSVSFNPVVMGCNVIHFKDYSEKEIQDTWYQKSELKMIRAHIRETMALMRTSSETIDDQIYCTTGLDLLTKEGTKQKKRNRRCARDAVLSVQEELKRKGESDDDLIAQFYIAASWNAQQEAYMKALQDEQDAKVKLSIKTTEERFYPTHSPWPSTPRLIQVSGAAA